MTEIFMVGNGGHAIACIDVIESEGKYQIKGIISKEKSELKNDIPYEIIGNDNDLGKLIFICKNAFIAIGQIKNSKIRSNLYKKLKKIGYNLPKIISPHSYISKSSSIGEGSIIMHGAIINAGAKIGNNCIINSKALIEHDAKIESNCHVSTGAIVNGGTIVKANTFIGSGSVLHQSTIIQKNSIIPAGSTVK